ncbi:hypothetical protein [Bradyrhizobium sp. WSM1743]|uniref:hypothetical protein n=1 Tax=Bradyrhizobium sp. WSM1743 TaxID=318996 RepID=UPI0012EBBFBF|nr:hypothetical protein [Bradyrhizobium sp. WSM1743]
MKLQLIALSLLIATPGAAETYKDYECQYLGKLFDNCAVPENKCDPLPPEQRGGGMSRAWSQLADAHPKFNWERLNALCKRVCDGKLTPDAALHRYCAVRPKL